MTNAHWNQTKQQLDAAAPPDTARTLMRLLVGAALLGMDEVARRAPAWERQAAVATIAPVEDATHAALGARRAATADANDAARRTLIGWLFATQERLRPAPDPARWLLAAASHLAGTLAALTGAALGTCGEIPRALSAWGSGPTVAGWQALGEVEEQRSRAGAARPAGDHAGWDRLSGQGASGAGVHPGPGQPPGQRRTKRRARAHGQRRPVSAHPAASAVRSRAGAGPRRTLDHSARGVVQSRKSDGLSAAERHCFFRFTLLTKQNHAQQKVQKASWR
jgi:hypothetical protein